MDNDVPPSIKSRRLSVGDSITFPKFLARNCYSIKDNIKYMVICNDLRLEDSFFPCAVLTEHGNLFFFHEYEII